MSPADHGLHRRPYGANKYSWSCGVASGMLVGMDGHSLSDDYDRDPMRFLTGRRVVVSYGPDGDLHATVAKWSAALKREGSLGNKR